MSMFYKITKMRGISARPEIYERVSNGACGDGTRTRRKDNTKPWASPNGRSTTHHHQSVPAQRRPGGRRSRRFASCLYGSPYLRVGFDTSNNSLDWYRLDTVPVREFEHAREFDRWWRCS